MDNRENKPSFLSEVIKSLRNQEKCILSVEGESFELSELKELGGGGSKTVYLAEIDGTPYALCLPNTTDDSETVSGKWRKVLQEPENTEKMRELGFLVNPICESVEIEVDGFPFTALIMTPYSELPFDVGDSKNPTHHQYRGEKQIQGDPTDENFEKSVELIVDDIVNLLRNKVRVGKDSFNIAWTEDGVRLYFNDLGSFKIDDYWHPEITTTKKYVTNALAALANSLPHRIYDENHETWSDVFFEDNAVIDELTEKAWEKYNRLSTDQKRE